MPIGKGTGSGRNLRGGDKSVYESGDTSTPGDTPGDEKYKRVLLGQGRKAAITLYGSGLVNEAFSRVIRQPRYTKRTLYEQDTELDGEIWRVLKEKHPSLAIEQQTSPDGQERYIFRVGPDEKGIVVGRLGSAHRPKADDVRENVITPLQGLGYYLNYRFGNHVRLLKENDHLCLQIENSNLPSHQAVKKYRYNGFEKDGDFGPIRQYDPHEQTEMSITDVMSQAIDVIKHMDEVGISPNQGRTI